jgi:4'-phosphopantetheinyl transferase
VTCRRALLEDLEQPDWELPSQGLSLGERDHHLWRIALTPGASCSMRLSSHLDKAERERAGRFHAREDGTRFAVAHGAMREILGGYLGMPPASISFAYGPQGKPVVEGQSDFHFNLSHSQDMALCAVTRLGPIGVDVEYVQEQADLLEVAARFFSAREVADLRSMDVAERTLGFYLCWVCKEAALKQIGCGLSGLGQAPIVHFSPEGPVVLPLSPEPHQGPPPFSTFIHIPAVGYLGAIAFKETDWQPRFVDFSMGSFH